MIDCKLPLSMSNIQLSIIKVQFLAWLVNLARHDELSL